MILFVIVFLFFAIPVLMSRGILSKIERNWMSVLDRNHEMEEAWHAKAMQKDTLPRKEENNN